MAPRLLLVAAVCAAAVGYATLGSASGAFTASTGNAGSSLATAPAPVPPTGFAADVTLDDPPVTCSATLTWTSSASPDATGYRIERLESATQAVVGGPWVVGPAEQTYVDVVPVQPVGQPFSWRIVTLAGSWASTPEVSTDFDLALCTDF